MANAEAMIRLGTRRRKVCRRMTRGREPHQYPSMKKLCDNKLTAEPFILQRRKHCHLLWSILFSLWILPHIIPYYRGVYCYGWLRRLFATIQLTLFFYIPSPLCSKTFSLISHVFLLYSILQQSLHIELCMPICWRTCVWKSFQRVCRHHVRFDFYMNADSWIFCYNPLTAYRDYRSHCSIPDNIPDILLQALVQQPLCLSFLRCL